MGGKQHRRSPRTVEAVRLPFAAPLRGRLLRRYQRFLADVETDEGHELTVHCPDPGSMRGCARPGARVRCSISENPRRRLRHTLEMIRVGRSWVGVNTIRANAVAARALERGVLPALAGYAALEREVSPGGRTRLDFRLRGHPDDARRAWVEVKSVTLADGSRGLFPDSVTERGRRHLEVLMRLAARGERAVLLYIVQRADCDLVAPAETIDPAYARTLRAASRAGVELFALGARLGARGIRELPVLS
jgi:sugar fermentation stimulation protein A